MPLRPGPGDHRALSSAFVGTGPGLQFHTLSRAPQPYYPDFAICCSDRRSGHESNYLAHEADFQFVKALENAFFVVPVVGDFGGTRALAGVAQWLRNEHETVSGFYTSNVEQYLFVDRKFTQFANNVAQFPRTAHTVMLRSYFMGFIHSRWPATMRRNWRSSWTGSCARSRGGSGVTSTWLPAT